MLLLKLFCEYLEGHINFVWREKNFNGSSIRCKVKRERLVLMLISLNLFMEQNLKTFFLILNQLKDTRNINKSIFSNSKDRLFSLLFLDRRLSQEEVVENVIEKMTFSRNFSAGPSFVKVLNEQDFSDLLTRLRTKSKINLYLLG